MGEISYLQPDHRRELFEVYQGPKLLGIVWKFNDLWRADPHSTAEPKLPAPTRDAAVLLLLAQC